MVEPMDALVLVAEIDAELRSRGTAGRAEHEKAYLKSDLEHDGTSVPDIRSVAKGVRRRDPEAAAVLDRWPAAGVRGFPGAAVTALRR